MLLASQLDCVVHLHVQYVEQCLTDDAIIDPTEPRCELSVLEKI